MDESLPNPPAELKSVLPFVQRANELRTADKVIAYWCCYYVAQLGISSNASSSEAKMYLLTLMDTLEELKAKLTDNDAVTNDAASSAYVENFALKVFVGADNEDRSGKATRATAKKFLAASQFIELLKIFGTLEPEMGEKIKYSKWKAADIAKAFKEGRKPTPGPAGGDPKEEEAKLETAMGPGKVEDSKEEQEYMAREMAKLTADAGPDEPAASAPAAPNAPAPQDTVMARGSSSGSQPEARAQVQPPTGPSSAANELDTHKLNTAFPDAEEMWKSSSRKSTEAISRTPSASSHLDRPTIPPSASFGSNPGSSRPLPVPPQRDGLPIPPVSAHEHFNNGSPGLDAASGAGGPGAAPASFWGGAAPSAPAADNATDLPSVPSTLGGGSGLEGHPAIERIDPPQSSLPGTPSGLPSTPGFASPSAPGFHPSPSAPSAPVLPPAPPAVRAVRAVRAARAAPVAPVPAPAPVPVAVAYPETLDPKLSTRVQKLARGAASAVDFEDLETARIQFRQALDILEGRTKA
ncbi:uncharacterized protein UBRO_02439 [Ustilago bromivora]|uniref:DUF605-domain-containing protein n=1 Tax=Ustilago bromivora TaxID=307758 RepID=A0A1K0H1A4_9BASI|nr:uncharacterized protein UBRO_02439 [Ustilago bromivora]SYW77818.1 uncharacterized protein UBRO2_02010 [Ustilago bromivora]